MAVCGRSPQSARVFVCADSTCSDWVTLIQLCVPGAFERPPGALDLAQMRRVAMHLVIGGDES